MTEVIETAEMTKVTGIADVWRAADELQELSLMAHNRWLFTTDRAAITYSLQGDVCWEISSSHYMV